MKPGTTSYINYPIREGSLRKESYKTATGTIAYTQPEEILSSLGSRPSIGIVVLTHNRPVDGLISALQSEMGDNHDLCIVEGGSTKEWVAENREACLQANVKHHWVSSHGRLTASMGRNYGASKVAGEYLYFIDGDCWPNTGWLRAMERAASPEAIAIGRVEFQQSDSTILQDHRLPQFGYGYSLTTFPWMMDEKNVMIPRKLFDLVGGFDVRWASNSYCWEGVDLYCRLYLRRRTPMIMVYDSLVTHQQDHEKNPDHLISDDNVADFHKRLLNWMRDTPVDDDDILNDWFAALEGEMRDRR